MILGNKVYQWCAQAADDVLVGRMVLLACDDDEYWHFIPTGAALNCSTLKTVAREVGRRNIRED